MVDVATVVVAVAVAVAVVAAAVLNLRATKQLFEVWRVENEDTRSVSSSSCKSFNLCDLIGFFLMIPTN